MIQSRYCNFPNIADKNKSALIQKQLDWFSQPFILNDNYFRYHLDNFHKVLMGLPEMEFFYIIITSSSILYPDSYQYNLTDKNFLKIHFQTSKDTFPIEYEKMQNYFRTNHCIRNFVTNDYSRMLKIMDWRYFRNILLNKYPQFLIEKIKTLNFSKSLIPYPNMDEFTKYYRLYLENRKSISNFDTNPFFQTFSKFIEQIKANYLSEFKKNWKKPNILVTHYKTCKYILENELDNNWIEVSSNQAEKFYILQSVLRDFIFKSPKKLLQFCALYGNNIFNLLQSYPIIKNEDQKWEYLFIFSNFARCNEDSYHLIYRFLQHVQIPSTNGLKRFLKNPMNYYIKEIMAGKNKTANLEMIQDIARCNQFYKLLLKNLVLCKNKRFLVDVLKLFHLHNPDQYYTILKRLWSSCDKTNKKRKKMLTYLLKQLK
jgi:hypothetical protein